MNLLIPQTKWLGRQITHFDSPIQFIKSDLSRDGAWEALGPLRMRYLNLVALNDQWSAFCIGHAEEKAKVLTEKRRTDRQIATESYVDTKEKTVRLPAELADLFAIHPPAASAFETLSFTNRKEYVEWIVSAKREETSRNRLDQIVTMLESGKKNPSYKG